MFAVGSDVSSKNNSDFTIESFCWRLKATTPMSPLAKGLTQTWSLISTPRVVAFFGGFGSPSGGGGACGRLS